MIVKFHGHYKEVFGDKLIVSMQGQKVLKDLVNYLCEMVLQEMPFCSDKISDARLSGHISFLRNGRFLKLNEQLTNEDVIEVMLPVTGG